jgi:tripartite ATP-independent transporter DctM subunit
MELFFLAVLILLMILALGAGFPVAFALPGSAIATILLAGIAGMIFAGDIAAYFAHGDPLQWLNAGVTNLRGIYWEAERDTLIAIPLFIFMGVMLERSKIAEDLLVTMAQLFGPVPGGLGISVVLVGALLAATTGIVGATVIAMGLISLPVMLRAKYSHSLATGAIAASGTLGQIIPPSIVLIILADQLSNATDQASALRTADYKLGSGNSTLPTVFDLTSTSAGDMFLGAFLPGMVLVGLYVLYILVVALVQPRMAPAAPFKGKIDRRFAARVFFVLVPPLTLIFAVLGSIILGIATVNQAGAIGAVGALVMAGYRLTSDQKGAYLPAALAVGAVVALIVLLSTYDINVKSIKTGEDVFALTLAAIAVIVFLFAVAWSSKQVYVTEKALEGVMIETAKTTSLVFIILLGAAMLTAAFRAFGGEELVRDFLTGLPGGFITKFVVVMAVIFLLGFFLDFIEIAVVVVPLIAPILLADPTANVTAVWLGVMIGVNMQTSFLTPPFGFALFYLRGVAPKIVSTIQMYRGVVPFILLQLLGLLIVGLYPPLVNYLPLRVALTADTAPPPKNPRLQYCVENYLFKQYDVRGGQLLAEINKAKGFDISFLPKRPQADLKKALDLAAGTFDLTTKVRAAEKAKLAFVPKFKPLHLEMRDVRVEIGSIEREIARLKQRRNKAFDKTIAELEQQKKALAKNVPAGWAEARKRYVALADTENKARRAYRRNVDRAFEPVIETLKLIRQADALAKLKPKIEGLKATIADQPSDKAMLAIRAVTREFNKVSGINPIRSKLSRARRALRGRNPDPAKAAKSLAEGLEIYAADVAWRQKAKVRLFGDLSHYHDALRDTIGLRLQERLSSDQAGDVAGCMSVHRDISLAF